MSGSLRHKRVQSAVPESLREHLLGYGIRFFDNEDAYWMWGGGELGSKARVNRLNNAREPMTDAPSRPQIVRFYDLTAKPPYSHVVHSMKADAIRASGEAIESRLPEQGRVLDVGCNLGYCASWYAARSEMRDVLGIDISEVTIAAANRHVQRNDVRRVRFAIADVEVGQDFGEFDVITDSQTICYTDLTKSLPVIATSLKADGVLISIPAIGNPDALAEYIDCLACHGLYPAELDWVFYSDLGHAGAYPLLQLKRSVSVQKLNLQTEYQRVWSKIRGVNH